MTLTLTHEPASGTVQLDPSDPLAPPPPAGNERWNIPVTLLLALLLNALLLSALFLRLPARPLKQPAEPPSIPVELVQTPQPQEPPKPQPQPQPKPEEKPQEQQRIRESGGSKDIAPGKAPKTTEKPVKNEPPKPEAKVKKPEPPKTAMPDWARQLEPGYGITRSQDRTTSSQPSRAAPNDAFSDTLGQGGGDPYLNRMRDRILAALVYPAEVARGAIGEAKYQVLIDRSGMLRRLRLTRSSGSVALDRAGAVAIQNASPFEPPPFDIPGEVIGVEFALRIQPKAGE